MGTTHYKSERPTISKWAVFSFSDQGEIDKISVYVRGVLTTGYLTVCTNPCPKTSRHCGQSEHKKRAIALFAQSTLDVAPCSATSNLQERSLLGICTRRLFFFAKNCSISTVYTTGATSSNMKSKSTTVHSLARNWSLADISCFQIFHLL